MGKKACIDSGTEDDYIKSNYLITIHGKKTIPKLQNQNIPRLLAICGVIVRTLVCTLVRTLVRARYPQRPDRIHSYFNIIVRALTNTQCHSFINIKVNYSTIFLKRVRAVELNNLFI